jgi:hypothetical protein
VHVVLRAVCRGGAQPCACGREMTWTARCSHAYATFGFFHVCVHACDGGKVSYVCVHLWLLGLL